MKVSIEKRQPDREGKRSLRLVYYYGSSVEDGQRKLKRSHEPLDIFIYDKPRSPAEREHNKEALRIAEAVRSKRLLESETSKHKLEDRTKLSASFLDFYDSVTDGKASGSKSNHSIWVSAGHHLKRYHGRLELTFQDVDRAFLEGFKAYLLKQATTKSDQLLSKNTASSYFNKIRAALNQAYQEGIIRDNPVRLVKSVKPESNQRIYLTLDEIKAMAKAECRYDILKRAFLFSCTTGLRWSDIQKLVWSEVEEFEPGHLRIIFKQKKIQNGGTALQYLDLPDSAVKLIGERQDKDERVFKALRYSSYTNVALLHWAMLAGVTKHVTFHAGRHSFAVNQLARGLDIYSLSRLLGHSELKTTEIYADILDQRRMDAMRSFPDIFADSL
ncbi:MULTISPECIES: site-specific integrase [Shewanella]|uniref:site-specific integrase n=1 Tax=Shewanella TaxID=22 RepID=UPI0028629DF1|nr:MULTISPECIES: site-specific integrase [Shewanella]MDR6965757.1 integrase [Shewanella putrefaciens]WVI93416.1 site-specific integrase [Shewanella oncorhynchi]